jgi:hypothetical protein
MKKKILLIGVVFAGLFAQAQEETVSTENVSIEVNPVAVAQAQEETATTEKPGLKINGYVDTYYKSNLGYNGGAIANDGLSPYGDSFELGNVNLKLSQDFGKAGFVAQLAYGSRAELANFDSTPSTSVMIQQAYVYYKPTDKVTLTAGNFSTFVGYEVIDAPANFHYSVSNLFQNGPYYHTGVKADVNLGEGLGLMLGVFNEMDRKSNEIKGKDVSTGKNVDPTSSLNGGAQLKYNKDNMNVYLNYLGGEDAGILRNQIDLVADYRMDKIYLAINPTFVTFNPDAIKSSSWYGAAGYAQYTVSDKVSIGGRLGYIKNEDKVGLLTGGNDEEMFDITLSAPLTLAPGLKIIPEIRMDQSKNDVYTDADGEATNQQFTLGLAAMYSF